LKLFYLAPIKKGFNNREEGGRDMCPLLLKNFAKNAYMMLKCLKNVIQYSAEPCFLHPEYNETTSTRPLQS